MSKKIENKKSLWETIRKDFFMLVLGVVMFLITVSSASAQDFDTYYVSDYDIIRGNYVSGDLNSLIFPDSESLVVQELDVEDSLRINFYVNINNVSPLMLYTRSRYNGGAGHIVNLEFYDSVNGWILIDSYSNSVNIDSYVYDISDLNVSDTLLFRYAHLDGGTSAHSLLVDYFVVSSENIIDNVDDVSGLLVIDFNDTINIIILVLFLVGGVVIALFVNVFVGGLLLFLSGILLLINDYIFFGFILIMFGVLLFFEDKDS